MLQKLSFKATGYVRLGAAADSVATFSHQRSERRLARRKAGRLYPPMNFPSVLFSFSYYLNLEWCTREP